MSQRNFERSGAPYPKQFRLGHSRHKTGCLTCRRRKKKCDELRPYCSACKRNSLTCEWSTQSVSYRMVPLQGITSQLSRACELTPESSLLLDHYTRVTALQLPACTQTHIKNPFLTCVLSAAFQDELLMHAVLAVSGTHLSHAGSTKIETATYKHYSYVLRNLQHEITQCFSKDATRVIRLLLVPAVLCLYEVLSGSTYETMSFHLRAMSQGLTHLDNLGYSIPAHTNRNDTHNTLSFLCEGHYFLEICNLILPNERLSSPPQSPPLSSSALAPLPTQPLTAVFGGSRVLYEIVPRANALFSLRLAEQARGLSQPTLAFLREYTEISRAIEKWAMPRPLHGDQSIKEDPTYQQAWMESYIAARCVRHALRIYMMTARMGCDPPSYAVESAIQREIEGFVHECRAVIDTSSASNILWAVIVAGTCVRNEELRRELVFALQGSKYRMRHLVLVSNALELLWADTDPRAFGPYGLKLVMEKNNVSFCVF